MNFDDRRSKILTGREKEILLLIRDGLQSKEIADRLGISTYLSAATVRTFSQS